MPEGESLPELGAHGATMCIHLAAHDAQRISDELTPSYGGDCPVAVVAFASRPNERVLRTTLGKLPDDIAAEGIKRTAVIIVGQT